MRISYKKLTVRTKLDKSDVFDVFVVLSGNKSDEKKYETNFEQHFFWHCVLVKLNSSGRKTLDLLYFAKCLTRSPNRKHNFNISGFVFVFNTSNIKI